MSTFAKVLIAIGATVVLWWLTKGGTTMSRDLSEKLQNVLPSRLARWSPQISNAALLTLPPSYDDLSWGKIIAGVVDRESLGGDALKPQGPGGMVADGHGKGLMSIDDRYHEFARTGNWKDAGENILYGATYLRSLYDQGGTIEMALAAYNAGPKVFVSTDPDSLTTGGDYSQDVLRRVASYA